MNPWKRHRRGAGGGKPAAPRPTRRPGSTGKDEMVDAPQPTEGVLPEGQVQVLRTIALALQCLAAQILRLCDQRDHGNGP